MEASVTAAPRVWFVTGASRGLGRAFTEAALAAGDRVVGAARDVSPLDDLAARHPDRLLALRLDVTDRAAVLGVVDEAVRHFGRLDVVVNNAGALYMGMIEEFTEAEARAAGPQLLRRALGQPGRPAAPARPGRRARRAGLQHRCARGFPSTGLYSASKFALEGMSEALAAEAAGFGVKVTIVQPGGYWTDLYTSSTAAAPNPAYDPLREELARQWAEGSIDSEPRLAAEALMKLVASDDPPLRLLLGSMVYDLAFDISKRRMDVWAGWEEVSRAAEQAVPAPGAGPA